MLFFNIIVHGSYNLNVILSADLYKYKQKSNIYTFFPSYTYNTGPSLGPKDVSHSRIQNNNLPVWKKGLLTDIANYLIDLKLTIILEIQNFGISCSV